MNTRGLTLLEVLAATALLAAMTAACVPMLAAAARVTRPDPDAAARDSRELAAAIRQLSESETRAIRPGTLPLDDLPEGGIDVRLLMQAEDGSWLVCTWRQGRVLLWLPTSDFEAGS